MSSESREVAPIDYRSPAVNARPRLARSVIVSMIGAGVALAGVIIFLSAHALATPAPNVLYTGEERRMHEVLWAAFGIALLLGGALIAAGGLFAWCREDRE